MSSEAVDPQPLLETLAEHSVKFVIIGGLGAVLHGSPVVTQDVDIAYERTPENLECLAAALADINAKLRGVDPDLPFEPDARALKSGSNFTFDTDLGELDCLGWPDGINSYAELLENAVPMTLGGHNVLVASIDDLIKMKSAVGRPKDRFGVLHLEAIKEMRDQQGD